MTDLDDDAPEPSVADSDGVFLFPASFGQERLWFLEQWEPGSAVYNVPLCYRLEGPLDVSILRRCLDEIVRRHEVLRTTFSTDDDGLLQVVELTQSIACVPVQVPEGPTREAELAVLVTEASRRPFDLATGPLFRADLFRVENDDHVLLLTFHHIVTDGVSTELFIRELSALYAGFARGRPAALPHLEIQYGDFAVWQRESLTSAALDRPMMYWRQQLAGLEPVELPTDRPRPKRQSYRGSIRPIQIPSDLTLALSELARHRHATPFMIIAAALQLVLCRYSSQSDVSIGFPVAGRRLPETDPLIGFFASTLVLRTNLQDDPPVDDLIDRVRTLTLEALEHQDVPFERLVEESSVQRDLSRSPLFQVLLSMQGLPDETLELGELTGRRWPVDLGIAKFDLSVYLNESHRGLDGMVEYNTDLFDAATIDRWSGHLVGVLETMVAAPETRVSTVPMLSDGERGLLGGWNATGAGYPRERTFVDLFEAQVVRRAGERAAGCGGEWLSYAGLDQRAGALARHLRGLGVAPGVLVGVCLDRSLDMLVGVLAVLKAGGAYVPLDPAFPAERLGFMLADSGAPVLVTSTRLLGAVDPGDRQVVCLDALVLDEAADGAVEDWEPKASADDLAYVLYTSGSTGQPKGVEISHRALTNFLWSMRTEPGFTEEDVLLAVTTLSFDIAGLELFLPLIVGGQVEIASRSETVDGRLLRARLDDGGITVLQATPATWRMLLDAGWTGTPGLKALIGGEALPPDLVPPLLGRTASLWNMYGPTETTIWSSVQRVTDAADEITIGRPIANTTFHILDARQQPVPIGVAGELFIGGDSVARGYRHRPELTAERFVDDPFNATPGERMYRTGDLARYRADGQVVHLGRLDHQVKVRGFRIELGEIETALANHPTVQQSVVVARNDQRGETQLVAYCVTGPDGLPTPATLRQHLRRTLPDYMVPQQFVALDALPLTPNGKIDRNQLPARHTLATTPTTTIAPRNPTEAKVAALFAEVLQTPEVSIDSDFFDLGGQSLLALRLITRIDSEFDIQLPLHTLFEATTVTQLAERITELQAVGSGVPVSDAGTQSATQHRLAGIWAHMLRVDSVSLGESFLDRGVPVSEMLTRVRQEFGIIAEGISALEFERDPTIAGLTRMIESSTAPSQLVVPLQPSGDERPLFLIHAGGGYVFFYRVIAARLGPHRPVYAIRARTRSDRPGRPFDRSTSIEQLAADYIAQIKSVQSHGPYTLGGACFGGVVAFEMARQLVASGESIASPLLLFDAFIVDPNAPPSSPAGPANFKAYAVTRVAQHLDPSHPYDITPTLRAVLGKAIRNPRASATLVPLAIAAVSRRTRSRLATRKLTKQPRTPVGSSSIEAAHLELMKEFLDKSLELLVRYEPKPYAGSAALFVAADGDNPEPGWVDLIKGHFDTYVFPGVHLDMLEEPFVADTAAILRQHLASHA